MALRHDDVEQVEQVDQEDRFTEGLLPTTTPSRDGTVDVTRDKLLVERCQAGDRQAFDQLYLRYQRRLHRFCMQRLGEAHDAEDVVQEAFVRAWRALPRFAGERRFYPWLTVIAANLCVDTMRRRARLTPVEESRITASDTGTYDIEDAVLHEVDSKMVATAFGQLSSRHQRVLQLREGSAWSYRKIAEHEGVGVTAVEKLLLWRARQALKREFLMLDEREQGGRSHRVLGGAPRPHGRSSAQGRQACRRRLQPCGRRRQTRRRVTWYRVVQIRDLRCLRDIRAFDSRGYRCGRPQCRDGSHVAGRRRRGWSLHRLTEPGAGRHGCADTGYAARR